MRAVRFSADDWMIELEMDLFAAEARERVERVQWRLSQRLLALGQRVIVEWGTWSRADRDGSRALTRDDLEAYAAVFEPPGVAELALYDVPLARARSARRRTSPGVDDDARTPGPGRWMPRGRAAPMSPAMTWAVRVAR